MINYYSSSSYNAKCQGQKRRWSKPTCIQIYQKGTNVISSWLKLWDWCYLFNLTLTSDNKLFFILLTEIMINDNNRHWKNNIGRIGRINTSRKTSYNVINPVFILTLLLHLTTYYVHYLLIGYFTILSFDLFCLFFAFILSSCYVLTL